jgi:hypothetical protein
MRQRRVSFVGFNPTRFELGDWVVKKNMRIADVAKATGLTLGTCYAYASAGILPPPRQRIGTVMIFCREDIEFFLEVHEGRPGARKSRRLNALRKR